MTLKKSILFWVKVYPNVAVQVVKLVLSIAGTFSYERGFSAVAAIKTTLINSILLVTYVSTFFCFTQN